MLRGVPQISFHPKSYFFDDLKPHAKFQNPTITPSGRKVTWVKERKRNNAVNSGHLVPRQRTQAARTNLCIAPYYFSLLPTPLLPVYCGHTQIYQRTVEDLMGKGQHFGQSEVKMRSQA